MNNTVSYKIDLSLHPTLAEVLENIVDECRLQGAQAAVVSFADCPFINEELTNELIERHFKYAAEYTFADGYPGGLAPEVLDAGTAKILLEMVRRTRHCERAAKGRLREVISSHTEIASRVAQEGTIAMTEGQPMTRTGLWDLIKTDVNAFEVETLIAPHDYRLWRLDFHTGDKRGALSCHALAGALPEGTSPWTMDADTLSQAAIRDIHVVRTVPAFYQVETRCGGGFDTPCNRGEHGTQPPVNDAMPLDKFTGLAEQMKALSGDAVVSIDAADPVYVEILAKAGLDILIEIGDAPLEDICIRCHDIDTNIRWIIQSPTDENIALLHKYFPGRVYPQLVRTTETEPMLETFYRKWSAADSPSGGKVLITKYCTYCGSRGQGSSQEGSLTANEVYAGGKSEVGAVVAQVGGARPDLKPADLSPLERNPCWHLRRDMVILSDGTVPLCFARAPLAEVASAKGLAMTNVLGNVFTDGLAALWDKMEPYAENDLNGERDDLCRKCDEYYTFNF